MKKGFVYCNIIVILLIGIAGAGKTNVKSLLLWENPPDARKSTHLAEEPVRVIGVTRAEAGHGTWCKVTLKKFDDMVIGKVKKEASSQQTQSVATDSATTASVYSGTSLHPSTQSVLSHHSTQQPKRLGEPQPHKPKGSPKHVEIEEKEDVLVGLVNNTQGTQEPIEVTWVYIVDTGGQPQFQEPLQAFMKNPSAAIYVLNLNESLEECPDCSYHDQSGNKYTKGMESPFSNKQLLEHCLHVMHSRESAAGKGQGPCMFVVGTHLDECTKAGKTGKIAEMNATLKSLLLRYFEDDKIGYYNVSDVIFPVNARCRGEESRILAQQLREAIEIQCLGELQSDTTWDSERQSVSKNRVPIPLPFFVFEMLLRKQASEKFGILTFDECKAIGSRLQMNEKMCRAALYFLTKHNVLFYDPDHMPELVFVFSEVLLKMLSALVYLFYKLQDTSNQDRPHKDLRTKCRDKVWRSFVEHRRVSSAMLSSQVFAHILNSNEFNLPYQDISKVFTSNMFLKLLEGLHIIAKVSENPEEYIMPCLLPTLPPSEGDKHRGLGRKSAISPLVLRYPKDVLPAGIFTFLVCFLIKEAKWKPAGTSSEYRNCVKFKVSNRPHGTAFVTLLHFFKYLEIHVQCVPPAYSKLACPSIHDTIGIGLNKVAKTLGYERLQTPTKAFLCPRREGDKCEDLEHHPASIQGGTCWMCDVEGDSVYGDLEESHKVWPDGPLPADADLASAEGTTEGSTHKSAYFDPLEGRPTMNQLWYLESPCKGVTIRIIDKVQADWEALSDHLALPDYTVRNLKASQNFSPERACRDVFYQWLHSSSKSMPGTWNTLIEVFKHMGKRTLADDIIKLWSK